MHNPPFWLASVAGADRLKAAGPDLFLACQDALRHLQVPGGFGEVHLDNSARMRLSMILESAICQATGDPYHVAEAHQHDNEPAVAVLREVLAVCTKDPGAAYRLAGSSGELMQRVRGAIDRGK